MDKEIAERYLRKVHHRMCPEVHTIREEPAGFAVYYMEHFEDGDFDSCYTFVPKDKLERFLDET